MSACIKKYLFLIENFDSIPIDLREKMLKNASAHLIKCISEISYNIMKKSVPVTGNQKRKLAEYKVMLKQLASHSVPASRKRKLLNSRKATGGQTGRGFLPLLFTIAAPFVTSLFNKIISRGSRRS